MNRVRRRNPSVRRFIVHLPVSMIHLHGRKSDVRVRKSDVRGRTADLLRSNVYLRGRIRVMVART